MQLKETVESNAFYSKAPYLEIESEEFRSTNHFLQATDLVA